MPVFDIDPINASVPQSTEGARFGATRIQETRTKLNEVINNLNSYEPVVGGGGSGGLFVRNVIKTSSPLVIPAGVTSIMVELLSGGSGGGGTVLTSCTAVNAADSLSSGSVGTPGLDGEVRAYESLTVVPGETLTITVGGAGAGGVLSAINARPATVTSGATAGANSAIVRASNGVTLLSAKGGSGGDSYAVTEQTVGSGPVYIFAQAGTLTAGGFNTGYDKKYADHLSNISRGGFADPLTQQSGSWGTYPTYSANGAAGNAGIAIISYTVP